MTRVVPLPTASQMELPLASPEVRGTAFEAAEVPDTSAKAKAAAALLSAVPSVPAVSALPVSGTSTTTGVPAMSAVPAVPAMPAVINMPATSAVLAEPFTVPAMPAEPFAGLERWRAAGWLRPLDLAFARFIHELDATVPRDLLLASALLVQLEGRGHSCLPLDELARRPLALLGWPDEAEPELAAALLDWPRDAAAARAAWGAHAVLQVEPADEAGTSPLVLFGQRLYLRRYWRYETHVAARIAARTGTIMATQLVAPIDARLPSHADGSGETLPEAAPTGSARDGSALSGSALAGSAPIGSATTDAAANDAAAPDPQHACAILDRLFASTAPSADPDWQRVACALALRGRLTLVTGGPGTGKTYTAARLLVLLQALHPGPEPLRVALAAPTGKAAARLRQSIDGALQDLGSVVGETLPLARWAAELGPARTLHSLLGSRPGTRRFAHDASNPLDLDLLLVDEASMVHLEMMAALLDALPPAARLILLGDKDQLASVEAGAVLGDLCRPARAGTPGRGYRAETARWVHEATGQRLPEVELGAGGDLAQQTVMLRESRRFAGAIGRLALAVNRGDGAAALAELQREASGAVTLIQTRDPAAVTRLALAGRDGAPGGYRDYLEVVRQRPSGVDGFDAWARSALRCFDRFRVLCAVREGPWGVAGLNLAIELALVGEGLPARLGDWYEGRPILVTRNDAALGVYNGDIGIVLRAPKSTDAAGSLRAWFLDGDALRSVSVGRLADVETAFALTVHKSQGSEFEHVALVLPEDDSAHLTRELIYTGITRGRVAFTLLATDGGRLARAVARLTRRVSGLGALLDRDVADSSA